MFLFGRRSCSNSCKWDQMLGEEIEGLRACSYEDEGKEGENCHLNRFRYISFQCSSVEERSSLKPKTEDGNEAETQIRGCGM